MSTIKMRVPASYNNVEFFFIGGNANAPDANGYIEVPEDDFLAMMRLGSSRSWFDDQRSTLANASPSVIPASSLAGAQFVVLIVSGGAALTHTTDIGANIAALIPNAGNNKTWRLRIVNTNSGLMTLAAGNNVTINSGASIAANSWRDYEVWYQGGNNFTFYDLYGFQAVPQDKATSIDTANNAFTIGSANIAGTKHIYLTVANAASNLTGTLEPAANIIAALPPNSAVGDKWLVRIINSGANQITVANAANTVITGNSVIAAAKWTEFLGGYNSSTTVTFTQVGSGNLVTETRQVSGFEKIAFSGVGDLVIIQDGTESVTVETDDNLLQYLVTDVRDGTLQLRLERNGVDNFRPTRLVFTVHVKKLTDVAASGTWAITAETIITDNLSIVGNGTGRVDIGTLTADSLTVTLSGAIEMYAAGRVTSQSITINGTGTVQYHSNP